MKLHRLNYLLRIILTLLTTLLPALESAANEIVTSKAANNTFYLEGYEPDPRLPEKKVRKVYLLIQDGKIIKKQLQPIIVDSSVEKITEDQTGPILLSAGFIDLHSHLKYNVVPLWSEAKGQFINRFQWRSKSSYKNNVTSYLNNEALGSSSDANSLLCQTYQYAEIKALLGGVTSIQGVGNDMGCTTNTLARNVEIESDYAEKTDIRVSTEMLSPSIVSFLEEKVFPQMLLDKKSFDDVVNPLLLIENALSSSQKFFLDARQSYLKHFSRINNTGEIRALIAHLAEGRERDGYNKNEYKMANVLGLAQSGLVIIHGVGMDQKDFKDAQQKNISIVWSPLSNLLLYGETLNVAEALAHNINITLGADWSPSGSKNLLDEVKIARRYLQSKSIRVSDKQLYEMMTINPARALKLENKIGKIEENHFADLVAFKLKSKRRNPYTQILTADPADIQLVMVGGKIHITKKHLLQNEQQTTTDSVQNVSEAAQKSDRCLKYHDTVIVNTPIKATELAKNLKSIIPVLDELTECSDTNYQSVVQNILSISWKQNTPTTQSDKKTYELLDSQLEQLK